MYCLDVQGRQVKISNPEKVLWPQTSTTKGQMLEYYIKVSPVLLPCLQGRLVALHRFPRGVDGKGFYQKNCPDSAPGWVKTFRWLREDGKETKFALIEDLPTLLWLANMGVIEFHPWLSSINAPEQPDYAVFDLDPMERYGMEEVRQVAQAIGVLLQKLDLEARVKTSGATGLQVFVSLEPVYTFQMVRSFVENCCRFIHKAFAGWTTMERSIAKRQGKIYLDYMQNARGQTIVSAYSLRAQPVPSFSYPLSWGDLQQSIDPRDYSLSSCATVKIFPGWMLAMPRQRLENAAERINSMLY